MYYLTPVLINVFLVAGAFCKNIETREAKFLGQATAIQYVTSTTTTILPSSCVFVEATAACRIKRIFWPSPQNQSTVTEKADARTGAPAKQSSKGWGEYLGIYQTVTQLLTKIETSTITDPRIVVTYAVKQCIPDGFPMNLSRCEIQTAPVELPASTIVATRINEIPPQSTSLPVSVIDNNELEPSNRGARDLEKGRELRATEPLSF